MDSFKAQNAKNCNKGKERGTHGGRPGGIASGIPLEGSLTCRLVPRHWPTQVLGEGGASQGQQGTEKQPIGI